MRKYQLQYWSVLGQCVSQSYFFVTSDNLMELAVITDEISQDLGHALGVMAEYGITAAEIRGTWGVNIADASDAHIEKIIATIEGHNAKVIGIATPIYKCDLPTTNDNSSEVNLYGAIAKTFEQQIESLNRCFDVALKLNTRFVRVFTFFKHGDLTPEIEDQIVEAFREPARLAEAAGIILLVENEHACFASSGVETARILKRINSPAVRSVWDPGNAAMVDEIPYPDGYEAIRPFISHVHVKDASANHNWTVVGEGTIDWLGQLKALNADGYDGYLSLETHYNGGGDPETSSRQCLDGLEKLVAKI
jgi:sugar phosphate isomerase/epimerase